MKMQKIAIAGALAGLLAFAAGSYADAAAATGSVSGVVNGPDGKPVSGASVSLIKFDSVKKTAADAKPKDKADDALKTTTDADGKFKIENVPAGPYNVRATMKNVGSVKSPVTVTAGQNFEITVQLKRMKKKA